MLQGSAATNLKTMSALPTSRCWETTPPKKELDYIQMPADGCKLDWGRSGGAAEHTFMGQASQQLRRICIT